MLWPVSKRPSFSRLSDSPPYVSSTFCSPVRLPTGRRVLAVVSAAALAMGVGMSLPILVFSPFTFGRTTIWCPTEAAPFYIPTIHAQGPEAATCHFLLLLFLNGRPGCGVE